MPEPKTCTVRRTQPRGPMTVCHDQPCLKDCIKYTKNEKAGIIPEIKRKKRKDECLPCPHGCTKKGEPMLFSNTGMLAWHIKAMHPKEKGSPGPV